MVQRESVYAGVEIAGLAAISMVDNLVTEDIQPYVAEVGLSDIDPEGWVPMEHMVALFNRVINSSLPIQVFVGMGMRIAEQSEFPPELMETLTMQTMLEGWNAHYQANHRGGHLDPVVTKKVDSTRYELHLPASFPYPPDMTYGMVYAFCQMLLPENANYNVKYDDVYSPYNDEAEGVIIHVSW